MLLLAEGLFRLDVSLGPDTFRTVVRNLSGAEIQAMGDRSGYGEASFLLGGAAEYQPAKFQSEFALGSGGDRVAVKIVIGTLRFAERGTARITAQAIIRQAPVS
jgi:hypothetical protein